MQKTKGWAIITGATSGFGEAIAKALAQRGHPLIITGRRKDRLMNISESLRTQNGVEIVPLCFDVSKRTECEKVVEQNSTLFAAAEILINNAGLARGVEPLQEGVIENWEEMIDTNVKGLLYMSRLILPYFIKKNSGHVVNLGSVAGRWVYPGGNVYCATKHAVRVLSESMRMDMFGKNIRVTNIEPGMAETEFSLVRFRDDEKAKKVYENITPLSAQDIAECVVWCLDRPPHVNIQEMVVYTTAQVSPQMIHRKT